MSNSHRWRRLMEWLRYLQETGLANKLNFEWLQEKIDEIKRGVKLSESLIGQSCVLGNAFKP